MIRQRASYTANDTFPMGDYSANTPGGIRKYPYTTDMKIDPETYGCIPQNPKRNKNEKGQRERGREVGRVITKEREERGEER